MRLRTILQLGKKQGRRQTAGKAKKRGTGMHDRVADREKTGQDTGEGKQAFHAS